MEVGVLLFIKDSNIFFRKKRNIKNPCGDEVKVSIGVNKMWNK